MMSNQIKIGEKRMNIETASSLTLEDMLRRDSGLIHMVAHKYNIDGYTHEDLFQEGRLKYMDVVKKGLYDASRGAFSTFICKCLHSQYSKMSTKSKTKKTLKYSTNCSIFSVSNPDNVVSSSTDDVDDKIYLEQVCQFIEDHFDPITSLLFTDQIKGYTVEETRVRCKELYGTTLSRKNSYGILSRKKEKVYKLLKLKGAL